MPINNQYYASAYDQPDDYYYQNQVPEGSVSNWVGHLTADDNGAAQVIDPGKLYKTLTGPMQAAQRRRADLDKQLRLAYMNYDSGKVPIQFRDGYQKLWNDFRGYYQQNQKALRNADPIAAAELEARQNQLKDYVAAAAEKGQKLKELNTKAMTMAPKKSPGWVEQFHNRLTSVKDPYDDADFSDLLQSGDKLDTYKAEGKLMQQYARPLMVKIGNRGHFVPNTKENMNKALSFANSPEGNAIIEKLAEDNNMSFNDAHEQYIKATTDKLNSLSLGGVNTLNKYDDHALNTMIKQNTYDWTNQMNPLKMDLMRSMIARNNRDFQFGNSQQEAQQFYNDLSDNIINDPQQAVSDLNNYLPAKSFLNGGQPLQYNPQTGMIEGRVFGRNNKLDIIKWPATPEGAEQAILYTQQNLVNPQQAATQHRLNKPQQPKPAAKPAPSQPKKKASAAKYGL